VTGCVPSRLQLRPVAGSFASTYGLDVSFFSASCLVALSENRVRQIQSLIIIIFHDNICHKYIYMFIMYIVIPVVPHKAVAEVSRIGCYRRGELL
jgi:hypothetical protein